MEMNKKRRKKKPLIATSLAAKLIEEIYDNLAAKMLVALYREKARAIKELEGKLKL